jgi:hypothetical protein
MTLAGSVTPELADREAARLHLPRACVAQALTASFSSILSGILTRAHDARAMRCVFALVTDPANDPRAMASPATQSSLRNGLLSEVFDERLPGVVTAIASDCGVGGTEAASLLGLAAALVMRVLDGEVRERGLDLRTTVSWIGRQGYAIAEALPATIADALGRDRVSELHAGPSPVVADDAGPPSWSLVTLLALPALAILSMLLSQCLENATAPGPFSQIEP